MTSLLDRVPPYIRDLVPYPPGKPIEEVEREYGISGSVKLASNESPLGPSPRAVEAAKRVAGNIHRYPDGSGYYLKRRLAEKHSVKPENIILGNGSNEVIDLVARAFIGRGDEAVMGDAAFIVYQLVTQAVGGKKVVVPLRDYTHDLVAMAAAVTERTRVVFVANPNNPTGTIVSREDLDAFFGNIPDDVLVVMDEAYHEYASRCEEYEDSMSRLREKNNLIVLRTFSKAYGLAGLRVGYGVASAEVISILERIRQPFNVNSVALAAAEAALDDKDHIRRGLDVNEEGMSYLVRELEEMGLTCVRSFANFILFDAARDGEEMYGDLLRRGVIVRPMRGYGLANHLRVTVGLPEENERFIEAMKECMHGR